MGVDQIRGDRARQRLQGGPLRPVGPGAQVQHMRPDPRLGQGSGERGLDSRLDHERGMNLVTAGDLPPGERTNHALETTDGRARGCAESSATGLV